MIVIKLVQPTTPLQSQAGQVETVPGNQQPAEND